MKKKILTTIVLSNVITHKTFAATGNASDGFIGVLVIIGFLFLVAGLLHVYDYLKNNRKKVIKKVFTFSKRIIIAMRTMVNKTRSEYQNPIYLSRSKIYSLRCLANPFAWPVSNAISAPVQECKS